MTFRFLRMFGAAVVLAIGIGTFASAQSQPPAPSAQGGSSQDQQITVVGCVEREADYRKAQDAGRGGVAGTGAGVGNEYVLSKATTSTGSTGAASTGAAASTAYELTGPNEGQLQKHVGHRIEITGKLKPAETDASGRPTGGATAGRPPSGVDVTSKDLKLREIDVVSIKMIGDTCPAT